MISCFFLLLIVMFSGLLLLGLEVARPLLIDE